MRLASLCATDALCPRIRRPIHRLALRRRATISAGITTPVYVRMCGVEQACFLCASPIRSVEFHPSRLRCS